MPQWSVPGYTGLRSLGSGGFGDVMLARHDASGVLVAIKYLRRDLLADPGFAEMFRGEATVLASLDDPNVVRLYEYVESPSGAAIVMELIDGVSVREILAHQGSATAEAALVVLRGSLMGLAAAHRRGVVHRDYKPENILVNGDGVSKLTDFGLAARAGDRAVPAGTLLYAAPEQIAGAPASPAGDVYSATATFYECLTGRPPFSGESADLLRQHRAGPVPLDPVPGPLRPLVATGMAKDPGRRPADALTFVTELETAADAAYGKGWQDRGRSHLGEAALLLAALWPSGAPPAAQGATVHRISLHRHIAPVKAAIAAGAAVIVVAAGAALAANHSHAPRLPSHPAAALHVSHQPRYDALLPGWTPVEVFPGPITSVSCSGLFCAAVGASGAFGQRHGYALTYSGGAWSKPAPLGAGNNYTVSCPSETYCVAVTDTGYAYTLQGSVWSSATDIYPAANSQNGQFSTSDAVKDISCASPRFCVAVTAQGKGLTWNGTTWSAPGSLGLPGIPQPAPASAYTYAGVSCPRATFCLTGGGLRSSAAVWNGTQWSPTPHNPVPASYWSVSCTSQTFCMIAGGYHAAGDISSVWNGAAWSGLARPANEGPALGFDEVSCSSAGFCAAIDGGAGVNGELATTSRGTGIFVWAHGTWAGPEVIDSKGALDAISCSASGLCVAADNSGNVFVDTKSTVASTGGHVAVAPGVAQQVGEPQVVAFLNAYFTAINSHDYQEYRSLLDSQMRQNLTIAEFRSGYQSTTDSNGTLTDISAAGPALIGASVTFTSHQPAADSPSGTACTDWRITLFLGRQAGRYAIEAPPSGYHASYRAC